jgi:sugar/nucleoside kinase (ribokinase family)
LILNEVEAEQLSGLEVKSIENAQDVALNLIEKLNVQKGVLITLGENGVIWTNKQTKRSYHKKCEKVQVIDSTVIFIK